ncbi:hypothetical protein AOLI_G00049030 [Acnodon oligacanthus]
MHATADEDVYHASYLSVRADGQSAASEFRNAGPLRASQTCFELSLSLLRAKASSKCCDAVSKSTCLSWERWTGLGGEDARRSSVRCQIRGVQLLFVWPLVVLSLACALWGGRSSSSRSDGRTRPHWLSQQHCSGADMTDPPKSGLSDKTGTIRWSPPCRQRVSLHTLCDDTIP